MNAPVETLDRLAEFTEAILEACGLPGAIEGGYYSHVHVKFAVRWQCDPLANVEACKLLTQRLRSAFNCQIAGVGADDLHVWLYGVNQ